MGFFKLASNLSISHFKLTKLTYLANFDVSVPVTPFKPDFVGNYTNQLHFQFYFYYNSMLLDKELI